MDTLITKSITLKADPAKAFGVWENFNNFPMFMRYVKAVQTKDGHTSHWTVRGPLGKDVEWTAAMTTYEPYQRIGWNTKDNDENVTTSGQVTFTPLSNGETQVTVTMKYDPEGGKVGQLVAHLFANPEKMLEEDLNNFKTYVEKA